MTKVTDSVYVTDNPLANYFALAHMLTAAGPCLYESEVGEDMTHAEHDITERRVVQIAEGPISYLEDGDGPTVVFLHGTFANANTWRKLIPLLRPNFRCIRPDLPIGAHHLPLGPEIDLSAPGIAQIIDHFLEALGLDQVVLVGNDTGGAYAQVHAANHPTRLCGMILSNTDCLDVFPPDQFKSMPRLINVPGYMTAMATLFRNKSFAAGSSVLGLLSNTLTPVEIRRHYLNNFITTRAIRPNLATAVRGWSTSDTLAAAATLAKDEMPTMIRWGADDELFPIALGQRLAASLPHADFATIAGASTYLQEDQPAQFASAVEAFVRSVQATAV